MSIGSDSRVVEALKQGYNLERLLKALGCDTRKDNGAAFESSGGFIHCPMPDHADANESASVLPTLGCIECRSLCGTIRPMDLVIAHGHAADRGEAAKFIEKTLGLEPVKPPPPVPIIDDPSLTVSQYLAMRGLPETIATKFELEDVRVHQFGVNGGAKNVTFETGWYNAVLMPNRPGRRPRVRCSLPKSKIKWAAKVRYADGRLVDYYTDAQAGPAREYPQDAIGVGHIEPVPAGAPPILVVVEGESDVHAMHAMGLPFVVGVPGSKNYNRVRMELLESCIAANAGDTDLSRLTVVVWQEPGSAGSEFPKGVARSISEGALEQGWPAPSFATLHHASVPGAPKDPASMLSDLPLQMAAQRMHDAILACVPLATVASQVAETPRSSAALGSAGGPAGIQPALEVLQVDGAHTPPPDTQATPETTPESHPISHPISHPAGGALDPTATAAVQQQAAQTIVYDVAGNPVVVGAQAPAWMDSAPQRSGDAPAWESFDDLEDAPERDLAPASIEGFNSSFYRAADGWTVEKVDKDGDSTYVQICSAFVVEQVERCSGEILVRVAAPFGGAWNRTRFELKDTADAGRTCAQLASIGVLVANRQRPAVTDLLTSLAREREASAGAVHVPAGTGWSGRPGTSDFGGIDVEPVNEFGARMFESNRRRRERRPDTQAAAAEWWELGAKPILSAQDEPTASGAAPLLAIGAAAAAPLVGPLAEIGVAVAPVVWIAGLGGGGKSVLQKLVAAIFAPSLPDLDGQSAYFANANISQAALSARVDSCRDLPLELDDVTQLPPLPGSTSRGDAARIEAAASLGMMVFNRKPIERATRDGGIRQTRAFRSTAIFSAEVSMSSESSKAVVTAGHRRRISTIEARPMAERGLGQAYAERVNDLSSSIGGAPGELLVARIREVVAARELRTMFTAATKVIAGIEEGEGVTLTQQQSLAVSLLGFALLCEAIGVMDADEAMAYGAAMLRPYLATGAGSGGATRDDDLTGVDAALRAVEECFAAHPTRFDREIHEEVGYHVPAPLQGYLGKQIRPLSDGTRRIVMLRPGMEMLNARYGVTMQVIEQATAEGHCKQRHQFRMSDGSRVYGTLWKLPPTSPDTDEPDVDPTLPGPHVTDPHGLAEPVAAVYVPGAGVAHRDLNEFTIESGVAAMLRGDRMADAYTTPNHESDNMTDFRFAWGAGLYIVGNAETMRTNSSLITTIRNDVAEELQALREHYVAAAAADPEGALGAPIEVADFPEWEDPRWAKIDGLGQERARKQWELHNEALWRANHSQTPDESRTAHSQHVKHYRIHLMSRYRHPEWFITDAQELA